MKVSVKLSAGYIPAYITPWRELLTIFLRHDEFKKGRRKKVFYNSNLRRRIIANFLPANFPLPSLYRIRIIFKLFPDRLNSSNVFLSFFLILPMFSLPFFLSFSKEELHLAQSGIFETMSATVAAQIFNRSFLSPRLSSRIPANIVAGGFAGGRGRSSGM